MTVTRAMAAAMATTWAMAMARRQAGDKEGTMVTAMRVASNQEGEGGKGWRWRQGWWLSDGNGNKEDDGNGDKGGRQVIATARKRVMAMAMRVAGGKEGNGDSNKSNGNGIEGGARSTETSLMTTTVMTMATTWMRGMAMRLAGNEDGKGKGSKGNGYGNDGGG